MVCDGIALEYCGADWFHQDVVWTVSFRSFLAGAAAAFLVVGLALVIRWLVSFCQSKKQSDFYA